VTYTLGETTLAPIPGIHGGTGTQRATNWVVDPGSVPGSAAMTFSGLDAQVTTKLFAIGAAVVPNWFGVAVPAGLSDFSRPHIFFHPTPGQAGYIDGDYAHKTGKWPALFYYMERLGYQLDGARRNQVLIMPFMTEQAKNAGILPANWHSIVIQILRRVRADLAPHANSPISIEQLVVSSFSAGIIYSDSFRRTGTNLNSVLAEVWDFDGRYSSYRAISQALHSTARVKAIKYDQVPSSDPDAYHVPLARWRKLVDPPASSNEVHGLIRDFMFLDAATVTGVGSVIETETATSADTGTATDSASGTHTGTSASPATPESSPSAPYPVAFPVLGGPGGEAAPVFAPLAAPAGMPAPTATPIASAPRTACRAPAITGLIAPVAATAQTAMTGIAAIAAEQAPCEGG